MRLEQGSSESPRVEMTPEAIELAPGFAEIGIQAFTTTRQAGDFAWQSTEPSRDVFDRWSALRAFAAAPRLVAAHQVHGAVVLRHEPRWEGLLRAGDADGHLALEGATAMAVSLADCVPVFLAEPSGRASIVHSGWRGTAADIAGVAADLMIAAGIEPRTILAHCGPAICGGCYVVGADVYRALTGTAVAAPTAVDLRGIITASLHRRGVESVTISRWCTRCHNDRFFSHRCGDGARQLGVITSQRT